MERFELSQPNGELAEFSPEQQAQIESKRQILSSLAHFIGKDFRIPVELNKPGAGWHWDFKENKIRIDPKDLLEKPMDYLRFVISHEGGHRRISRTEFIPLETWKQPGFSFMMNAIEDPRDNNFVAESYPKFAEQMQLAYQEDLNFEKKSQEKAKDKLGYTPRFMQAGFEYIKQWFKERQDQEFQVSKDLPEEVKKVVKNTLDSAQDSWWRYPSRAEADNPKEGEDLIKKYAQVSYEINNKYIWPEFKKLVEKDLEDQKMQEFMKDTEQQKGEGQGQGLSQELKDKLSPEEQKELEEAIEKAIEEEKNKEAKPEKAGANSKPINLDSLSEELKQKIKDYLDSLPEDKKKELQDKAQKTLSDFEKDLNQELEGKLSENPEKKDDREKKETSQEKTQEPELEKTWQEKESENISTYEERRKRMEDLFETKDKNFYNIALEKTSNLIDNLTADLRDIFVKRKLEKYESGYRSGRRWDVRKRVREKVANIPLFKTEARQQPVSESEEADYAITLMIDLSGSMRGRKIQETFKSAVVLAETLNNLGVKFEIVGFQDILLEFKSFEENLNEDMRKKLNQLVLEVDDDNPGGHNNSQDNNDGECLMAASKHLANQTNKNKFLIVLSDGVPAMDSGIKSQNQLDSELKNAVTDIVANTNQKLIGIGLLSDAVKRYYKNNIADVTTEEMVEILSGLLREIIEKY